MMGFLDRLFRKKSLSSVNSGSGWTSLFGRGFHANFQTDVKYSNEDLTAHPAVFACVSLIAQDIGKMGIQIKKKQNNILVNAPIPDDLSALKKPNHYQTWQQFLEFWMICRKLRGNVYVLIVRDPWQRIVKLVILNPDQVTPLVSDDGKVFYQLGTDRLNSTEHVIVPASEIIHDRENCLYHPLVGIPAITAYGLAAGLGLNILKNSKTIFGNMSRPSGILTAPGAISPQKAKEAGDEWNRNFSGQNIGKTAVLGDGLQYQSISMTASDSQTIEQLKMTNEVICSVLHVPAFKVGMGSIPAGQKVADLNEIYFSDCLQSPVEAFENLMDDALGLKDKGYELFLNIDALIRMDKGTQIDLLIKAVGGSLYTPNEARAIDNKLPLEGGDTIYMQQQNYSLQALAKRDQKDDPFGKAEAPKTEPKSFYQGVFKSENSYEKGCFVTHKGSLWHCEKAHSGEFNYENFKLVQKKWGFES